MNERIKELAELAVSDTALAGGKRGDKDFDQRYNTEFAELIIQECIENIEQFDHHINPAREVVPTMISQIKEHFGDKE